MGEFATSRLGGHHESEAHSSRAPIPSKQTLSAQPGFAAPVQLSPAELDGSPTLQVTATTSDRPRPRRQRHRHRGLPPPPSTRPTPTRSRRSRSPASQPARAAERRSCTEPASHGEAKR